MNIYKALNEMIDYIENNLEEQIDYNVLAKFLGVNRYTMERLFTLLCNISLSDYIRKRRLSNAGYDLYNQDGKVIDIAIKYGYDNPTSFSRAFEKFHGIKPSLVKNNPQGLKNFPKIVFEENNIKQEQITYDIITLEQLELYGKFIKTNKKNIKKDAPSFCNKMTKEYQDKYGPFKYGMTVYEDRNNSDQYEYWILYDKPISEFSKYIIPASKWLVFKSDTRKAVDIQQIAKKFYIEFLPSSKFNLRDLPELEVYYNDHIDYLISIE